MSIFQISNILWIFMEYMIVCYYCTLIKINKNLKKYDKFLKEYNEKY